MKYHIDIGNSSSGPIGLCAVIEARSKKEALSILDDNLGEYCEIETLTNSDGIEYCNVYFNISNCSIDDVDEWDE